MKTTLLLLLNLLALNVLAYGSTHFNSSLEVGNSSTIKELNFNSCPVGSVTLSSQTEVDNFEVQFLNCTVIDGDLTINGFNSDITDLSGFQVLETINGRLRIRYTNVSNFNIFPNLRTVSGSLELEYNNDASDISGFNSLIEVGTNVTNLTVTDGRLRIFSFANLTDITGFADLETVGNFLDLGALFSLTNINGFAKLKETSGLTIFDTRLANLNGFSGLNLVYNTSGTFPQYPSLFIEENPNLTSIAGINFPTDMRRLEFNVNPLLEDLSSLQTVERVFGRVRLRDIGVTDLNDLSNIELIGGAGVQSSIEISDNENLENLNGLSNFVDGRSKTIFINNNPNLTDISALDNLILSTVSGLIIRNNSNLSTCASTLVCSYLSDTTKAAAEIQNNATGCESVAVVEANCSSLSTDMFDQASISIYPVPFENSLNLNLSKAIEGQVKIFDMAGKVLIESKLTNTHTTLNNLGALNKGLYILRIESSNGTTSSYKVVKR